MIDITMLGTSDQIPTAKRNHTAIFLKYKGEGILVDCGEGTQRQFRKARLNPCKVTKILITHWHGDHVLGLPGLLQTLSFSGYNKTLEIYGPKGTKFFMKKLLETFVFKGKHSIKVFEVDGKFFETNDFYLESKKMTHGAACNAYHFVKKGLIRIDKKKLKKSKIPIGKHLLKLKQGKNITYKGKKYFAKNLTFTDADKKVSFILDTGLNKSIIPFVKNSDLLICEASFEEAFKDRAKLHEHLTSKQAAEIAKKSNSKKLVLTHLSSRYEKDQAVILKEARKIFKNSVLAKDFDVFSVK